MAGSQAAHKPLALICFVAGVASMAGRRCEFVMVNADFDMGNWREAFSH